MFIWSEMCVFLCITDKFHCSFTVPSDLIMSSTGTLMLFSATYPWKTRNLWTALSLSIHLSTYFSLVSFLPLHAVSVTSQPSSFHTPDSSLLCPFPLLSSSFCRRLPTFQALFVTFSRHLSAAFLAFPISHSLPYSVPFSTETTACWRLSNYRRDWGAWMAAAC